MMIYTQIAWSIWLNLIHLRYAICCLLLALTIYWTKQTCLFLHVSNQQLPDQNFSSQIFESCNSPVEKKLFSFSSAVGTGGGGGVGKCAPPLFGKTAYAILWYLAARKISFVIPPPRYNFLPTAVFSPQWFEIQKDYDSKTSEFKLPSFRAFRPYLTDKHPTQSRGATSVFQFSARTFWMYFSCDNWLRPIYELVLNSWFEIKVKQHTSTKIQQEQMGCKSCKLYSWYISVHLLGTKEQTADLHWWQLHERNTAKKHCSQIHFGYLGFGGGGGGGGEISWVLEQTC